MKKIGFLVNPISGMGGKVALKGTDGQADYARSLGAEPVSEIKANSFLNSLNSNYISDILFFTPAGPMGEDSLKKAGLKNYRIISNPDYPSDAEDTKEACEAMLSENVDLIIFCGGDGTARDVVSVTKTKIPVLGIPSGVKMFSGVFAVTPEAGAEILGLFPDVLISETEVLDIDEEEYRKGNLRAEVFGIAKVPAIPHKRQGGKWVSSGSDERNRKEIGDFLAEIIQDDVLYLVGAGFTAKSVFDSLNLSGYTMLGVDALINREIIQKDLSEKDILNLLRRYKSVKIILSPIGAQGFLLGRGNQQFSPDVLKKAGIENIIVAATEAKLSVTNELFIDTGDPSLNIMFPDSILVICGDCMAQRIPVAGLKN
ncbi:MAG: ATP-NAD kinase family protein [Methanomicrobiaceae archaeon]|nr:ATP-NAD kinase family protein [Methanomicrobiaceae archaeon]